MENNVLEKEIWIQAPVETVFASFTQADKMLEWHGKEVEVEPIKGGIYRVVFENGTTIIGEFLEVIENQKVVYKARYGAVESTVSIELFPEKGGTRIQLKQEFLPGQDTSSFNQGWDYFLGLLQNHLETGH